MSPYRKRSAFKVSPAPDLSNTTLFWLLGGILVFAPLFRSGQPALAVLVLELLSVSLLAVTLWRPRRNLITRTETLALTLLVSVPLLYLIPLPAELIERLPGRELYLDGRALLAGVAEGGPAGLSLYPRETESALLLLLLPIAVFIGTRALDASRVLRLVFLLLALAALQSLLGILQYSANEGSPLLFGMQLSASHARGTYTNVNHLAGLLEMLLPVALALLVYSIRRRDISRERKWKRRMIFFASGRGHLAFVYGALALLLLVGIIFTRSRTGITLSMLALLLSMMAFAQRIGGTNVYGPMGTIVAVAVGMGVTTGLVPVLDRFSIAETIHNTRWSIFSATLDGIGTFLPVGSGPGTYPDIFPAFQPPELGQWFINHAHNDYLEWLFEGGLLFAALILLLLVLYVRQWRWVWTRNQWSCFQFVQVAAGIGLLLLLLHSLSDFNLHIPANIAYFAFLAAVFFSAPGGRVESVRSKKRRRTPSLGEGRSASAVPGEEQPSVPVWNGNRGVGTSLDDDPSRIRQTLSELTRCMPRVLLLQLGGASAEEKEKSVSELRVLGDRLAAYIQAIERYLQDQQMPADEKSEPGDSVPGHRGDLEALRMDIEAVIAAVDAFVDHPGHSGNFSHLDARLGDAEQRCRVLTGESAMASTSVPQDTRLQRQVAREREPVTTAQGPGPSALAGEAPAEQVGPDSSRGASGSGRTRD
ncbi:O-antigen ligase family protein [Candidatus Thiosymbion oneisti]|uniref:O-antigen ligase family protein n=1 Tax=Candidatus Thiosymbion oneisti TaxID=589554 RepID=UPI000AFE6A69|nr:O-antigen ligase family protein [Candidatus Thiosymbion oneisti]